MLKKSSLFHITESCLEGFHLQALAEPHVNLSIHMAPIIEPEA